MKIGIGRDKVWWPMREYLGKDREGRKISKEVFRNMQTGEVYEPENRDGESLGWNGTPPVVDGRKVHISSKQYSKNYERIFRHQ